MRHSDDRWIAAHRRSNLLVGVCVLLAVVIVGLVWYAYPTLKASDASLHNLPSLTQRFNQSVTALGDRVKQAEAKVGDSLKAQQSLGTQVKNLGQDLHARIDAVRMEASRKLDAQTDGLATVKERVSRLETERDGDQVQIAQLQQQLNKVEDGQSSQKEDLDALKSDLAVRKIAFEAAKDQSNDLAEGITLHVESTNPAIRQVSGWMWVGSDGRSIWLTNQSAQQPVIFYGNRDGQKRELVFTNITPNSVTGYLLLPKQAGAAALGASDGNAAASAQ